MELRQLQYFVAAARTEHFTRAARRLNIVQSALSSAIRSLETELDAQLFVRTTRQVRLTAAGRVLLEKAEIVLEAAREARQAVDAVKGAKAGKLNIGTVQGLPAFLDLPSLLARFHERYPQIEVRLVQGGSGHLLDKVRNGVLDLAFLPMFEATPDIATTMIACEDLVVVHTDAYPLADGKTVSLNDIKHFPFVDFEHDWGTRKLIDDAFLDAGVERRTAFEVSDLETLLDLASRGLGIALVPESIAAGRSATLKSCRISGVETCWEVVVVTPAMASSDAAPQRFLELLGANQTESLSQWDSPSAAA
jgi:DNA-binding transcriptional LysR family regulator